MSAYNHQYAGNTYATPTPISNTAKRVKNARQTIQFPVLALTFITAMSHAIIYPLMVDPFDVLFSEPEDQTEAGVLAGLSVGFALPVYMYVLILPDYFPM